MLRSIFKFLRSNNLIYYKKLNKKKIIKNQITGSGFGREVSEARGNAIKNFLDNMIQ